MGVKIVDCILLAMLKEERTLFLKNNKCLIYDQTSIHKDFLEFNFFDKNNKLRSGVFCSLDREMGNNEASRLFYELSRHYHSALCINIGVVGYINEVNIGDVIIVDENYSLCEKNVANSSLQKTDAKIDQDFIRDEVCSPLECEYAQEFEQLSGNKMSKLRCDLENYFKTHKKDRKHKKNLEKTCKHNNNVIKLGACATYHSVVKDKDTREAINAVRKTNIVDMEAYYFNYWHKLIRNEEYEESLKNSKMIFFKSISDTAIKEEKAILEAVNSRELAMSNIYDVVTFYISNLHTFDESDSDTLLNYFNNNISQMHVDSLIKYSENASQKLNKLCPYIMLNDKINNIPIEDKCIELSSSILKNNSRILVLEGNPGKGKSAFISYVYKEITKTNNAVFISIPEMLKANKKFSANQTLFFLDRLLKNDQNIIVFVDGVEGSRHKTSDVNKTVLNDLLEILNQHGERNISLCIGAWQTSDVNDIRNNILNRLNPNNEVYTLKFKSVSAMDSNIKSFIENFANYYNCGHSNFDKKTFVSSVLRIIKNQDSQLGYIDFRLLNIFAKHLLTLKNSSNIYEFFKVYCYSKTKDKLDDDSYVVEGIESEIFSSDEFALLRKNIFSRAFVFAEHIFNSFVSNNQEKIDQILSNKYILSDNINLFLEHMLKNNLDSAKKFVDSALSNLSTNTECPICTRIQLLYIISSIKNLNPKIRNNIKNVVLEEIARLENYNMSEQESDTIIAYRTLAIVLNNKFNNNSYLNSFNEILAKKDTSIKNDIVKKVNQNFHLLYYSQMEFTYDRVEEDFSFDTEVVWNTYQILRCSLKNPKCNDTYSETCAITLLQLIEYIRSEGDQSMSSFFEESIEDSMKLIKKYFKNIE